MLNIDASSFDSNTAVQGAGAGYTFGSDGSITSSAFTNNSATGAGGVGGAVYLQDSAFTVSVSTFSGNSAFSGAGSTCPAMRRPERVNDTSFQHVTIANNTATDGGGLWLVRRRRRPDPDRFHYRWQYGLQSGAGLRRRDHHHQLDAHFQRYRL
ncbi:MAG: hypothetical protein IPK52_20495 [Chloroflexi bacterium]|nr:hypothetical protein [Chloroflexota bacterium]